MKIKDDYSKIIHLHKQGFNKSKISRETGITRSTVRYTIKRWENKKINDSGVPQLAEGTALEVVKCEFESLHRYHYAYILGMYLGDGYINKEPRCWRLRISLDLKYNDIINKVKASLSVLFPFNSIQDVRYGGRSDVGCYSKSIPLLFPQHGKGKKHNRKIFLKEWQKDIVNEYPWEFLKGLIFSDGCRYTTLDRGCEANRYAFSNLSKDIRDLFKHTCEQLDIKYAYSNGSNTIYINQKDSVKKMDKYIGFKT